MMYFQIGGHPAFNFLKGSVLEINKQTNLYEMKSTPYVQKVRTNVKVKEIKINNETFAEDALIYDDINSVVLRDQEKMLKIDCEGLPFIEIWSKYIDGKTAPFVCLEPWYGITDCIFHNKHFKDKKGINLLAPREIFTTNYKIELG